MHLPASGYIHVLLPVRAYTDVNLLRSAWRHWGCTTRKILENMKESLGEAEELDGFEDLNDEDKARIKKAWEEGHVDPSDVPDTQDAMIAMTEEEEKLLIKLSSI